MVLRAKVTEVKKLDLRRFPFPDVFQTTHSANEKQIKGRAKNCEKFSTCGDVPRVLYKSRDQGTRIHAQ